MLRLQLGLGVLGALALSACGGGGAKDDWLVDASSPVLGTDAATPAIDASSAVDAASAVDAPAPFDAPIGVDAVVATDASARVDAAILLEAGASDAGDAGVLDAAPTPDATSADAAQPEAGKSDATTPPGSCAGSTPHGCWPPKAGNPMGCPPQIHEQSAFYPPLEEWEACSSPYYEACIYLRPDGSEANCSCDLGLHWLCTY